MASKIDDSIKKVSDNQQRLEAALHKPRLFEAVDQDDLEQLKQILTSHPDGLQAKDKYGSTLLHRAAGKGSKECLKYVLEDDKESVSKTDKKGCQPLHYAAYNGQAEAVQLLLENKADINAKNREGQIPLLAACMAGRVETATPLLDQHYEENSSELPPADTAKNTLLHMSVIGNHAMVKELLGLMKTLGYTNEQLQELVNSVNVAHQTILHIAAIRCQLPTIKEYLSQLQLSVDTSVKDKKQKTCEDYAQKCQKRQCVMDQNKDPLQSKQPSYRQKSPNTLTLDSFQPNNFGRNSSIDSTHSTLSKVTPSTDGVNVLGEWVKQFIVKNKIANKDHKAEVHVLTSDELPPEDCSLALNRSKDTTVKLELLCGLHGSILDRLPSDCHLVGPIVMVKLGTNRPLMIKVTIPHALGIVNKTSNNEVRLFAISTLGVPEALESKTYALDEKSCIVTMVINRQQIFVLMVMGKLLTQSRSFASVNLTHRPPTIKCIYYVLSEPGNHEISVKVYCAIDLPISWKLLSENKKQPTVWGTFMLSYEHIEISYQCVKNYAGWNVFNSSQKMNALSILPSPQAEQFIYPPLWEFKVFPRPDVKHVSEKVTCELRIAAGKTKLVSQRFHHDCPASYYSKQSTPVSVADPLLNGHGEGHGERLEFATPTQCDTLNADSMEGNGQADTIHMQPRSNGHNNSQDTEESNA